MGENFAQNADDVVSQCASFNQARETLLPHLKKRNASASGGPPPKKKHRFSVPDQPFQAPGPSGPTGPRADYGSQSLAKTNRGGHTSQRGNGGSGRGRGREAPKQDYSRQQAYPKPDGAAFGQGQTTSQPKKPRGKKIPEVEVEKAAVPGEAIGVDNSSSPLCINSLLPVGGRLSHFVHFWEQNVQDTWALEVVREGYALEFEGPPPTFQGVRVTRAKGDRARFLREEIQSLLLKAAIERVPPGEVEEGFYSTFFLTSKKDGTWRPILNLKPLNAHLRSRTFKMETLRSVVRAVDPGDWMASIDLKDAYLHVPIRKSHHKYLRFAFEGVSYQCKVLMFGLKTGPFVWTKILAPILAMIHRWGIYISPYLDDLILKNSDKSALVEQLPISLQTLINAGFIVNLQKSELQPCQDLVYIGGRLRTDLGLVTLPHDRMEAFLRSLSKFKVGSTQTAGFFQHILGMIAAMLDVVPYARLRMRPLQVHLKRHWNQAAQPQSTRIPVTERLTPCLQWWSSQDHLLAGLPLCPPKPNVTITSDASKKGWGAFLLEHAVQGLWGPWEKAFHINFLELKAIWLGLKAFQDNVEGKVVLCRCDNTTACAYINKMGGTKSQVLTSLLTRIMEWCIERNIHLQAVHLPGVKNVLADMLSRTETDHNEWSLNTRVTDRLFLAWGKPQVDLFASRQNAKLPTFCSLHREEELALSWDALSMTWSRGEFYAFPPLVMIPIVLDKNKAGPSSSSDSHSAETGPGDLGTPYSWTSYKSHQSRCPHRRRCRGYWRRRSRARPCGTPTQTRCTWRPGFSQASLPGSGFFSQRGNNTPCHSWTVNI